MLNFFKEFWKKIKDPKPIHLLVFYLFFVCIVSAALLLVICVPDFTIFHYICFPLAAISLTYFVYTIVYFAPTMKKNFIEKLEKNKFTKKMLKNYGFRTIVMSVISFVLNAIFVIFMGISGIITKSFWYISLAVYYLILILVKGNIFYSQKRKNTKLNQLKAYRYTGIMCIFLTLALSGIIVLIYKSNMYFEYAGIMIYAVAAYTFYLLGVAIYNIVKARKYDDLFIQSLKNINFVTALVSIVVLQVAMFQAFSPQNNTSFANGLTGGVVSLVILITGILMIVKANKNLKQNKNLKDKNLDKKIEDLEKTKTLENQEKSEEKINSGEPI